MLTDTRADKSSQVNASNHVESAASDTSRWVDLAGRADTSRWVDFATGANTSRWVNLRSRQLDGLTAVEADKSTTRANKSRQVDLAAGAYKSSLELTSLDR